MPTSLALPRYLVVEPTSTVRIDLRMETPSCEIDVSLDNPKPGRSFVLLIGPQRGPFVQRVRLAGRARIHFDPQRPGKYSLLLANPLSEPIVIRLKVRELGESVSVIGRRQRHATRAAKRRSSARIGSHAGDSSEGKRGGSVG